MACNPDLIQEGNIGLMKAVDKFEYRRGYVLNLRNVVDPAGDHAFDRGSARTIRIPVHMIETINKLNRISRQMLQEMGREPLPEELAERMMMPEDKIRKVLKIAKEPFRWKPRLVTTKIRIWVISLKTIRWIYRLTQRLRKLSHSVREVLGGLTAREAKVLRMRFGIDMNTDHTLEEVGKQFDVTREQFVKLKPKHYVNCVIQVALNK